MSFGFNSYSFSKFVCCYCYKNSSSKKYNKKMPVRNNQKTAFLGLNQLYLT